MPGYTKKLKRHLKASGCCQLSMTTRSPAEAGSLESTEDTEGEKYFDIIGHKKH